MSHHARYQCRHAGACCHAGWHIPVEAALRPRLGTALLTPAASGACSRYDAETHRCSIHRDLGEASLPLSCDQFPRVSLVDDRGVFIALSHFCPTAAAMLFEPGDLRVVADPDAFPASRRYDGLDARGAWPPLVRERLLFGFDDYARWEAWMVETFATAAVPSHAIARIAHAVERLRAWTSAEGAFSAWLDRTCETTTHGTNLPAGIYDDLVGVPALPVSPAVPASALPRLPVLLASLPVAINRYLAGKCFGSWSAYQGRGIRTTVAELLVSHAVLRAEIARLEEETGRGVDAELLCRAVQAADWRLVHSLDRQPFMASLGRVEAR